MDRLLLERTVLDTEAFAVTLRLFGAKERAQSKKLNEFWTSEEGCVTAQTNVTVTWCAGSRFNKWMKQYHGDVRLHELSLLLYNRKRILMWCFISHVNTEENCSGFFYSSGIMQVLTFDEGIAPNDLVLDLICCYVIQVVASYL